MSALLALIIPYAIPSAGLEFGEKESLIQTKRDDSDILSPDGSENDTIIIRN